MSDSSELPPPTSDTISFNEVVLSQMNVVRLLNQQSRVIIDLMKRVKIVEDTLLKLLGVDEQGRIPGMQGYDGPLKEEVEKYQQLKAQADQAESTDKPEGFGAYL